MAIWRLWECSDEFHDWSITHTSRPRTHELLLMMIMLPLILSLASVNNDFRGFKSNNFFRRHFPWLHLSPAHTSQYFDILSRTTYLSLLLIYIYPRFPFVLFQALHVFLKIFFTHDLLISSNISNTHGCVYYWLSQSILHGSHVNLA